MRSYPEHIVIDAHINDRKYEGLVRDHLRKFESKTTGVNYSVPLPPLKPGEVEDIGFFALPPFG